MNRRLRGSEIEAICDFINEAGHLKHVERAGWKLAGISDVESVAEHTYRTALIGAMLAHLEGADPAKTALICLLHDVPEARIGDIPSIGKKYLSIRGDVDVAADQTRGLPPSMFALLHDLALDYQTRASEEAKLAKDADRLECLAQAKEYVAAGRPGAQLWVTSTLETIQSSLAQQIGDRLAERDPTSWWRRFVERYRGHASDVADV